MSGRRCGGTSTLKLDLINIERSLMFEPISFILFGGHLELHYLQPAVVGCLRSSRVTSAFMLLKLRLSHFAKNKVLCFQSRRKIFA